MCLTKIKENAFPKNTKETKFGLKIFRGSAKLSFIDVRKH